jgi:RimJ/RimL family protein N-acetyltransferase
MLHPLLPRDYQRARPLFGPLAAFQPFCAAVLAGLHPGRVFVDDPAQPRTGFACHDDPWCFLAGDPGNDGFVRALNRAIYAREAVPAAVPSLLFTCHPGAWTGRLGEVMAPRQPIPMIRRHYVARHLARDWRAEVPAGYRVQRLAPALLDRRGPDLPGELRATLARWRAWDGPRFGDFGFVALHGAEVAAWATVDAVVEGAGDAGLFTLPAHRRRGLALVVSAAAVEYGLAHGLTAVHWTCAETNAGSIRIAEKLGFARQVDYRLYLLVFDEAEHLGTLAYHHLQAGRHRQAVDLLEQAFALEVGPPAWAYLDAARAWAALDRPEEALARLATAVDWGCSDLDGVPEFERLRHRPEWAELLARAQRSRT